MTASLTIKQTLQYFQDKRLLSIFCFGIASGFPWVLIGSAMSGWLKDEGLSRSSIGLFGLIFVAYSINFLWSPLVDRLKIAFLTKKIGMRRSWILVTQLIIVIGAFQLSTVNALEQSNLIALYGLIIALAGATQDISIDAYRIDLLNEKDKNYMAAGSAMATSGWWTGFAGLGSIPFILVDQPNWEWPEVYLVLSLLMLLLMITVLVVREPISNRDVIHQQIEQSYLNHISQMKWKPSLIIANMLLIFTTIIYANIKYPYWPNALISSEYQFLTISLLIILLITIFVKQLSQLNQQVTTKHINNTYHVVNASHRLTAWLLTTMVSPIHEFFTRNGTRLAFSILMFIFLFKLGEAYLGRMSIVFYKEVGFSNADIAYYSKMINWAVTIVFSLIGSVFTIRYGILKGLFIGGIAMSASNLLFAAMALTGPDKLLFAFTVFVDGFTSAWGSVAFVALLSVLCNKSFTASQYALMASLGTFGRVMLGSYSGIFVDWLDGNWALFFVLTSLMVIPSLIFLYSIRKPLTLLIERTEN